MTHRLEQTRKCAEHLMTGGLLTLAAQDALLFMSLQAGIDPQSTRWLEDELASPAGVEDIADRVQTPEKAAQVYAAARLAIDPDTRQEREFLRQLAESLDLDPDLARQIDDAAASVRA